MITLNDLISEKRREKKYKPPTNLRFERTKVHEGSDSRLYSKVWFNTPELCSGSNNATLTKFGIKPDFRINDVGGNAEIGKFQYYVSTKLLLDDAEKIRDQQNISKYGTAAITDVVYRNRIIISRYTRGVVLDNYLDEKNNLILEVCFGEDDSKRILFKQEGPGQDRKLYLVYQDVFNRTINYGGELLIFTKVLTHDTVKG